MQKTFIGLDFGSDSVRALLVTQSGEELKSAVCPYPRWTQGLYCDPSIAKYRQHPLDYLEAMENVLTQVLEGAERENVAGIGIDTTGSTPCASNADGRPLSLEPEFAEEPDAMFLLWKDHTSCQEASEINAAARLSDIDYTQYEGGIYSAEWYWSKYLHVLRNNPRVAAQCKLFVEHCDWIGAELAGTFIKPGRCAAGHKAMWHASWGGLPPESFLVSIDPCLAGRRPDFYRETFTAGQKIGRLSDKWMRKLNLKHEVSVAIGAFDCHAGAVGAGIRPGTMVKIMGTSTCDIIVAPKAERCVQGICGQVDGSVIPGMVGFEAGQSAFGDIYAWFKRFLGYAGDVTLAQLEKDAMKYPPGNIIALDWMNGRRSPDANNALQGAIFGLTLGTTPPEVYRALVEATAFGSRRIAERFVSEGVNIRDIIASGGIALKSPFVMQTCADILNMPIAVVKSEQCCALGAAIFAATASGIHFDNAMNAMAAKTEKVYVPQSDNFEIYQRVYHRYLTLSDAVEQEAMYHS